MNVIPMEIQSARYVKQALDYFNGNKRKACRRLDISYHTINRYLAIELRWRGLSDQAIAVEHVQRVGADDFLKALAQ
jgi:hypothetical protein